MRRLCLLLGSALVIGLAGAGSLSGTAHAVDPLDKVCAERPDSAVCQDNQANSTTNPIFGPSGIVSKVINVFVRIVGVAAVLGVMISGGMMIYAGGDSQKAATARTALVYCLVGLGVAVFAQLLVAFVINKL